MLNITYKKKTAIDEKINNQFLFYQECLDERNDKHERLVKLSRDITIESKRIIFELHRTTEFNSDSSSFVSVHKKFNHIKSSKWFQVAKELFAEDPYQFLRAYSPGLQEYIEALTFRFYLENKRIMTLEEVQTDLTFTNIKTENDGSKPMLSTNQSKTEDASRRTMNDEMAYAAKKDSMQCAIITSEAIEEVSRKTITTADDIREDGTNYKEDNTDSEHQPEVLIVKVPPVEYFLGLADLTGEIMRFCINCLARRDQEFPKQLVELLRLLHRNFSSLDNASSLKDLNFKMAVLKQSLLKVEASMYAINIRGSEFANGKHLLTDLLMLESGNNKFDFNNDLTSHRECTLDDY